MATPSTNQVTGQRTISRLARATIALVMLLHIPTSAASAQTSPAPNIYANFLGTWSGTQRAFKPGQEGTHALELKIAQDGKKNRLRFDYTYGKHGDKEFSRTRRFVEINPDKSELILQWQGDSADHYKILDLSEFVRRGLGTFSASMAWKEGRARHFSQFTLSLEPDSLQWQWEESPNGLNYEPLSLFTLKRVGPAPPISLQEAAAGRSN